jgi:hypothetical protein
LEFILTFLLCTGVGLPIGGFDADGADELEELRARVRALEERFGEPQMLGAPAMQLPQSEGPASRTVPIQLLPPHAASMHESTTDNLRLAVAESSDELPVDQADSISPAPQRSSSAYAAYGDGLEIGFWGWLSYLGSPQRHYSTFWAWEAELDITKSFTDRLAASADIDFTDTNDGAITNLEQLFVSILFPCHNDAILTLGKFNAPFGVERRDFWDRVTGSASLLFYAQPRDLTGIMVTQPCERADLTLRAFVVNGFDHNLDINQQPSIGFMAEHHMCPDFSVALTNWWGPEFDGDNDHKLYFAEAQATWQTTPDLSLCGEVLYGTTSSPHGRLDYNGYLLIVSYALCDTWRLFGQWSDLNDHGGFILGGDARAQEVSVGLGWFLHRHVEARFEYRHDFNRDRSGPGSHTEDVDELSAHLTFGY